MIKTEKLSGTSLDITAENRAHLKALFPTVFTETKNEQGELVESIDFEKLKAELGTFSDVFESRRERYGMEWPGKKEALRLIQTPSAATLKPCRTESVNFDTTENLFIEGDNLEVLKLLQKSYYGKVKMIYIDPPYNTGKEFIYPDNFSESLDTYLEYAGLIDGDGKKFSTNTANEGRFHTKWLNMMYPRLYLARNLLRDDGVIFISIDDAEISNLINMSNEIFGEENLLGKITVVSNMKGRSDDKYFATAHNYLLCYRKNNFATLGVPLPEEYWDDYPEIDENGKNFRLQGLRKRGSGAKRTDRPKMHFPIYVDPTTRKVSLTKDEKYTLEVVPRLSDGIDGRWRWGKDTVEENIDQLIGNTVGTENRWDVFQIDFAEVDGAVKRIKPKSVWIGSEFSNESGNLQVKRIIGKKTFDTCKPTGLLNYCLEQSTEAEDIVLDFFSGSGTTAHSVLSINKSDGGRRKFILVQLPEHTYDFENGTEIPKAGAAGDAYRAGFKTISEIGKERIRRVIKNFQEDQSGTLDLSETGKQDLGFKVFKLDKSNFRQWQQLDPSTPPEQVAEQLSLHIDHISDTATPEDLLYEILLKAGFTPTEKIETKTVAGKNVFSIAEGALLLCLEEEVSKELINAVADLEPMQFLCRDSAFHGNDQLKANAVQTFAARNMQKEKHNQIIFKTV